MNNTGSRPPRAGQPSSDMVLAGRNALREALESDTGYIIDCAIDIDEMVRPMVGGGSHITEFMLN